MTEVIDTPEATITIEDRLSGDGQGTARTVTYEPKSGSPTFNREQLAQRAEQALTANATYLALANPSNAQNLAQIRLLTRECSALIRLAVQRLESTEGT